MTKSSRSAYYYTPLETHEVFADHMTDITVTELEPFDEIYPCVVRLDAESGEGCAGEQ